MKKIKLKVLDTKDIPTGMYCYSIDPDQSGATRNKDGDIIWPKFKLCPYWSLRKGKPKQNNGYCKYTKSSDWESEGLSLLWDQVKDSLCPKYDTRFEGFE